MFMEYAHSLDLQIHPYTLQDDMLKYTDNPIDEALVFLKAGVDGLFCDFTENALVTFEDYAGKYGGKFLQK